MQAESLTMITQNARMRELLESIDLMNDTDSSVLLIGETGVGKELFAEYIHRTSRRAAEPFVKVGLAALPRDLLESELFGHERGAYTSAHNEKKGLFELANHGSIFLDDIDDFPLELQSKLLRVLESGELMRVGGQKTIPVDVRLITATKIDLKLLVEKSIFRPDLYYRINVVPISIPSLRDRRDDIPILIDHFIKRFVPDRKLSVDEEAMNALVAYGWPGNVRELRNVIQRVVIFANGAVRKENLPNEIREDHSLQNIMKACTKCLVENDWTFEQLTDCLEMNLLTQTLKFHDGNRTQAAKQLGLSLSTFRDKLKKHGID
ncbi:MAG: sigma-54-dependent Fis family transcriptional regulator [Bacteroidetes bacterium]|nr:sigma-54-dependent Fis family transcriptional regulator [Bacteroidota bacterium]